jgi:hypothetical protein
MELRRDETVAGKADNGLTFLPDGRDQPAIVIYFGEELR